MTQSTGSSRIHNHPGRLITIRRATLQDLEAITEMSHALAATNPTDHSNPDEVVSGVRAVFERPEYQSIYYIAVVDGHAVGQVLRTCEWNDHLNGLTCWFRRLFVSPEFRRRGIALALLQYVIATSEGAKEFRWNVALENLAASRLFEQLGGRFYARHGVLIVNRSRLPGVRDESDTSLLAPPTSVQQAEAPR